MATAHQAGGTVLVRCCTSMCRSPGGAPGGAVGCIARLGHVKSNVFTQTMFPRTCPPAVSACSRPAAALSSGRGLGGPARPHLPRHSAHCWKEEPQPVSPGELWCHIEVLYLKCTHAWEVSTEKRWWGWRLSWGPGRGCVHGSPSRPGRGCGPRKPLRPGWASSGAGTGPGPSDS